jgi:hypothetical protein
MKLLTFDSQHLDVDWISFTIIIDFNDLCALNKGL